MLLSATPEARLAAVSSAMPDHRVGREETTAVLTRLFPREDPGFIAQMVERSGIHTRHIALPVEDLLGAGDFGRRNAHYQRIARELALCAARKALDRSRTPARDVDVILDVSCTGISIPALDVDLVPLLGLRSDVLRLPITESGCAAGALALGLAGTLAQQGRTCLVIAVELCSLTFCREDASRTNLVASCLFGDGAAAAVVAPSGPGPRLVASGSHLFADTRDLMGFDVGTHGLRIVLQRELPAVLRHGLRDALTAFLARHDRTCSDVALHLVHPGGRRILDAYSELMDLGDDALDHSREALRRYGNLSSVSILTVLELALDAGTQATEGAEALALGIGPGLSMELSLWSWSG